MADASGISSIIRIMQVDPVTLLAVLGTYATVLGAGWGVGRYLDDRKISGLQDQLADHTSQIDELNARHGQELKRLGELNEARVKIIDEDFPGLNDIDPIDLPPGLPSNLKYHPDFSLVSVAPTAEAPWSFTKSTHVDVFSEWFGDALTTDPHLRAGLQFVSQEVASPCLLWKGKGDSILEVEDNPVFKKMYPFIIVRHTIDTGPGDIDYATRELMNFVTWLTYWEAAVPGMSFKVQKMSRTRDTAYLRGFFEFRNFNIGGKIYERFYLMRQVMMRRSGAHRYVIYTGFPNADFQDPYCEHLKDWWSGFRIIK